MLCFADSLHIFQALFLFDLLYYLFVPLDDYDMMAMFYTGFNFSMLGLAILETQFPNTSELVNPYVIGGLAVMTLMLLIVTAYSGAIGSFITVFALLILAGVTIASFEQYGADILGSDWGSSLDTTTRMYLGLLILTGLFVCGVLIYYLSRFVRFFACTMLYSLLALFAVKVAWFQGFMPAEVCCDPDVLGQCPFFLGMTDIVFLIMLAWLRIMSFSTLRWHARYKIRYQTLRGVQKDQAKHNQKALQAQLDERIEASERETLLNKAM
jgi:hypothetical protein